MNNIQKTYDSNDKTNMHLKMQENLYHQRNLYLIKNRKPIFGIHFNKQRHDAKGDLSK